MAWLRDHTFSDPVDNILFDQLLLEEAEADRSGETLRFWESPVNFIVLGRVGRPHEELRIESVRADRIPVLRRCSGGGTVLQGPGCLNYACVLSKTASPDVADLRRSYQFILRKVIAALNECGVEAEFLPISDIALKDGLRKISGNAQKRGRRFILHHGTILYNADLSAIERYLAIPPSMPDYRQARGHLEFVTNATVDIEKFRGRLAAEFSADSSVDAISEFEKERLVGLRAEGKTIVEF